VAAERKTKSFYAKFSRLHTGVDSFKLDAV
jgi:hypothetical protein